MYSLNVWGLQIIELIQSKFGSFEDFFTVLSNTVGHPTSLYTFYFPAVYGFDSKLAVKMVQAAVAGDWLNVVMKWILMGDRPYWWIQEAKLADEINIQQFYNTCETGPGTPSGHVAITGVAWFILSQAIIDKVQKKFKINIKYPVWTAYAASLSLLALSRMYIAAHFPHQCFFGFACAIISGKVLTSMDLDSKTIGQYLIVSAISICTVFLLHGILEAAGIDVSWTIRLAKQWCAKPEWVHASTSPYYMTWRFTGILLGIGIISNSEIYKRLRAQPIDPKMRLIVSLCGLITTRLLTKCAPDSMNHPLMYLVNYLFHAAMMCVVGMGVPLCLKL